MRKLIFILLFILPVFSFSQEVKETVKRQFLDYHQLISNKNFSKAIDIYAPEGFLKMFSKDMLIASFDQLFNNSEIKFTLYPPLIEKIEMLNKKIDNISYGRIFYCQKMEVEKGNIISEKNEKEKINKINSYINIFKDQFGECSVTYNEATGKFEIISYRQVIAISSDEKNWKYVIADKKQEQILKKFIPQELLNDLK